MKKARKRNMYILYNGFRIPNGYSVENLISAIDYKVQPGEIFIATYPKCGTTWAQHIVWLLRSKGLPLSPDQKMSRMIPQLEEFGKEGLEGLEVPRIIKTHLPYSMSPHHPEAKYIYIARNPFDCLVSFYHHTKGFPAYYDFADGTFDEYFEYFIEGEVDFGDYFDNLLSWYAHREDNNLLFLTYESMKKNIKEAVIRIAEFLGGEYDKNAKNKDILNNVLLHSSFEYMSKDQSRWSSERSFNIPFIRKGWVGDWKNYFSEAQKKRLADKFKIKTKGTELHKLWAGIIPD